MLKIIKFSCFLLFTTLISVSATAQNKLDAANIKLGLKLLQTQIAENTDNFVVSATSVYTIAAMLAVGAEGQAREELRQNILAPDGIAVQNTDFSDTPNMPSQAVEINNAIWGDDFDTDYKSIMQNTLLADAFPRPKTTEEINDWIKQKTKGRISSLIMNKKTQVGDLYLVNTVFFKDKWQLPFEKENTHQKPFYSLNQTSPDSVMMMYQRATADYYEDQNMQALRLYYKNGDSIQIFLPHKDMDFVSFIKNLRTEDLQPQYLPNAEVDIYLPKFEVYYRIDDMRELFRKMGVYQIFQPFGNPLAHISPIPHFIRQIVHIANIKIDEEGTVATAATIAAEQEIGFAHDKSKIYEFMADRPFLFVINDGLFIGLYTKPDATFAVDDSDNTAEPQSNTGFFSRLKQKIFHHRPTEDAQDDTWKSLHYED